MDEMGSYSVYTWPLNNAAVRGACPPDVEKPYKT